MAAYDDENERGNVMATLGQVSQHILRQNNDSALLNLKKISDIMGVSVRQVTRILDKTNVKPFCGKQYFFLDVAEAFKNFE